MTDQKDNYIPDGDSARRDGSTWLTTDDLPLVPSRPASEGDEHVLASIARRHASRLGLRQAVRRDSPQAVPGAVPSGANLVPPDAPPTADEGEPPVVSPSTGEAESSLPDSTGLRETSPKGVFYVRRAICKSQCEPARGRLARSRLARGRLARVLIVYLVSMAVLVVALCFVTWLDEQRNEEFTQTRILVDGGRDSEKTEDPEVKTQGRRNTVIVVDR